MDETGKPMRFDAHTTRKIKVKEQLESSERVLGEEEKRFFPTLRGIDVRRKSGRGAKNEENC
jgi:ribosomal protein S6E (S10)